MGVFGVGKFIIGKLLVKFLDWYFFDVDFFYFKVNIEKMSNGIFLSDVDWIFWLKRIRNVINEWLGEYKNVVFVCFVFKKIYCNYFVINIKNVKIVYL